MMYGDDGYMLFHDVSFFPSCLRLISRIILYLA